MGRPYKRYGAEAIKKCREYYIKYNADSVKIEKAMRQDWSSWSRKNLFDSGNGNRALTGWINKYGFERSLQEHLNLQINQVENDDRRRYAAVVKLGDEYQEKSLAGDASAVPVFLKLTDQQISLRTKLDLAASNLESFTEALEKIISWSKEIDKNLARLFYINREEFIRRAKLEYGGEQTEKD